MKFNRIGIWTALVAALVSLATLTPAMASEVLYDTQPGSFLVFPIFDVRPGYASQIRITNTNKEKSHRVQINVVCPGVKDADPFCDALDVHIDLTPYETKVINVADLNPPCDEGFIVAFAENSQHHALSFDFLIGSYHIRFLETGSAEASQALAIQSVKPEGENLGADGQLQFGPDAGGPADYAGLPTHLFTDFRATGAVEPNGNDAVVNSIGGDDSGSELILLTLDTIAGTHNPTSGVAIKFFNEKEVPFSTSWQYVCWTRVPLEDIDFNFVAANLGTEYGSMKITPEKKCPLPGGCPPLNEFDPAILGAIDEFGNGYRTKRNLFHDGVRKSTVYVPR